jgi:hypothetical protein
MKIQYTPTFADYWALHWHVLRKQYRWMGMFAIVLLVCFFISPFLLQQPDDSRGVLERYFDSAPILFIPVIIAFSLWFTRRTARKRWGLAPEVSEAREYEITNEGIRVTSKSIQALNAWSIVKKVEITTEFVFIKTGQNQFFYFPVSGVSDLVAFRAIVDEKVPNGKTA